MFMGYRFKTPAIAVLLVLYSAVWARPLLPWISYTLNPSAFAQNCENKDKPKMHCNGKCQAMKAAAKASADENKARVPGPPDSLNHLLETEVRILLPQMQVPGSFPSSKLALSLFLEIEPPPPKA